MHQSPNRWRKWTVLWLLLVALTVVGCGRARPAAPAPGTWTAAVAAQQPTATQAAATPTARPTPTAAPTATRTASPTPVPPTPTPSPTPDYPPVFFAVIGDFGQAGPVEEAVAQLVREQQPDFIVTVGDNNYPNGNPNTWDENVTAYYGDYIEREAFFPAWGNHDWGYYRKRLPGAELVPYLPGNRRYYDFVRGPVHFFVLDSNWQEPAGATPQSKQARWLQERLAASTTPWQVVVLHHAPFSSGRHGSLERMQWPYAAWGADLVLAGHDHTYERIERDGLTYVVNGVGGHPSLYPFENLVAGSIFRFNEDHGALFIWADAQTLRAEMHTLEHGVIDAFTLQAGE